MVQLTEKVGKGIKSEGEIVNTLQLLYNVLALLMT